MLRYTHLKTIGFHPLVLCKILCLIRDGTPMVFEWVYLSIEISPEKMINQRNRWFSFGSQTCQSRPQGPFWAFGRIPERSALGILWWFVVCLGMTMTPWTGTELWSEAWTKVHVFYEILMGLNYHTFGDWVRVPTIKDLDSIDTWWVISYDSSRCHYQ